eukprot:651700-Amphidinium_carterae.1
MVPPQRTVLNVVCVNRWLSHPQLFHLGLISCLNPNVSALHLHLKARWPGQPKPLAHQLAEALPMVVFKHAEKWSTSVAFQSLAHTPNSSSGQNLTWTSRRRPRFEPEHSGSSSRFHKCLPIKPSLESVGGAKLYIQRDLTHEQRKTGFVLHSLRKHLVAHSKATLRLKH